MFSFTFMAIIEVNLLYQAPPVKNWMILLVQSFTAHMPLLMATSAFGLGRRHWRSQILLSTLFLILQYIFIY